MINHISLCGGSRGLFRMENYWRDLGLIVQSDMWGRLLTARGYKAAKGKAREVWSKPQASFQESSPTRVTQDTLVTPARSCDRPGL